MPEPVTPIHKNGESAAEFEAVVSEIMDRYDAGKAAVLVEEADNEPHPMIARGKRLEAERIRNRLARRDSVGATEDVDGA